MFVFPVLTEIIQKQSFCSILIGPKCDDFTLRYTMLIYLILHL